MLLKIFYINLKFLNNFCQLKKMKNIEHFYIHVPFCISKCNFCDFAIIAQGTSKLNQPELKEHKENNQKQYLELINREFSLIKQLLVKSSTKLNKKDKFNTKTVYIGGGTPSLLSISNIHFLGKILQKNLKIDSKTEFSFECEPNTLSTNKIDSLEQIGVNRFSMGVQSTKKEKLKLLGRSHTFEDVKNSLGLFYSKFGNLKKVSVDFMIGYPKTSVQSVSEDLKKLLSYNPGHLSLYILELEKHTKLHKQVQKGELEMPSEDSIIDQYIAVTQILDEYGMNQYQISNFAINEKLESRHNKMYWESSKNYLGLGMSSSSLLNDFRYRNYSKYGLYKKQIKNLEKINSLENFFTEKYSEEVKSY